MTTTHMAREIAEQPAALAATLEALRPQQAAVADLAADRRHVLFIARGTSGNAAVYGRYLVEVATGYGAAVAAPSLATHYSVKRDLSDTLAVSISQSGGTEEIIAAQAWAREQGARTLAITNGADSELAAGADLVLVTDSGGEMAVPATKSHTSQLLTLALLADALADGGPSLIPALTEIPEIVGKLIEERSGVDRAAEVLFHTPRQLVTARGMLLATATEMALKFEETCLRPVRSMSYADLRHGPIATVDHDVAAVLIAAANGPMLTGMHEVARDLIDLGAKVIAIGGDQRFTDQATVPVPVPELPETLAPIAAVVPGQLIVEQLANNLGCDPDFPKGLAKITQTDPTSRTAAEAVQA